MLARLKCSPCSYSMILGRRRRQAQRRWSQTTPTGASYKNKNRKRQLFGCCCCCFVRLHSHHSAEFAEMNSERPMLLLVIKEIFDSPAAVWRSFLCFIFILSFAVVALLRECDVCVCAVIVAVVEIVYFFLFDASSALSYTCYCWSSEYFCLFVVSDIDFCH